MASPGGQLGQVVAACCRLYRLPEDVGPSQDNSSVCLPDWAMRAAGIRGLMATWWAAMARSRSSCVVVRLFSRPDVEILRFGASRLPTGPQTAGMHFGEGEDHRPRRIQRETLACTGCRREIGEIGET
jgi:hypothetical protein